MNYLLDPWQTYYTVDKSQISLINQNRIDYFLISEDIFLSLKKYTKIIPEYRTRHSTIVLSFSVHVTPTNWGANHRNNDLIGAAFTIYNYLKMHENIKVQSLKCFRPMTYM